MAAGCGGIVHRGMQGPTHCLKEPVVAGLWFAAHGRTAWLAFACPGHADQLIAPRPLLPRDRDVLNRRRDRHRTEIAGSVGPVSRKAHSPEVPQPRVSLSGRRLGLQPTPLRGDDRGPWRTEVTWTPPTARTATGRDLRLGLERRRPHRRDLDGPEHPHARGDGRGHGGHREGSEVGLQSAHAAAAHARGVGVEEVQGGAGAGEAAGGRCLRGDRVRARRRARGAQRTDWLRRQAYKNMEAAGVRKVRLYAARHACLTYLRMIGVPGPIVSAWAGHGDLTIADRVYVHPTRRILSRRATSSRTCSEQVAQPHVRFREIREVPDSRQGPSHRSDQGPDLVLLPSGRQDLNLRPLDPQACHSNPIDQRKHRIPRSGQVRWPRLRSIQPSLRTMRAPVSLQQHSLQVTLQHQWCARFRAPSALQRDTSARGEDHVSHEAQARSS